MLLILILTNSGILAQQSMQIEYGIKIGQDESETPTPGTIRWTGSDFQGYNGLAWVTLTSNATIGTVTDVHFNTYNTMRIGKREWMLENLNVERYNDGTLIPHIQVDETWFNLPGTGAWCWYNNEESNNHYGRLYNFYAINTDKLCPTGWSIPTMEDWEDLWDHLGGQNSAAGLMKEDNPNYWTSLVGDNASGFSALPGGFRIHNGLFNRESTRAYFWAFLDTGGAQGIYLTNVDSDIKLVTNTSGHAGLSVSAFVSSLVQ